MAQIWSSLLEFQVFQTRFSGQKKPQNDKHKKKTFSFLGRIDFTNQVWLGWLFWPTVGGCFWLEFLTSTFWLVLKCY